LSSDETHAVESSEDGRFTLEDVSGVTETGRESQRRGANENHELISLPNKRGWFRGHVIVSVAPTRISRGGEMIRNRYIPTKLERRRLWIGADTVYICHMVSYPNVGNLYNAPSCNQSVYITK
jgi:hypothetical protein